MELIKKQDGQGLVEYGMLIGLIGLLVISAVVLMGPGVLSVFEMGDLNRVSFRDIAAEGESGDTGNGDSPSEPSGPAWKLGQVYLGGDRVVHDGKLFEARYWT